MDQAQDRVWTKLNGASSVRVNLSNLVGTSSSSVKLLWVVVKLVDFLTRLVQM